MVRKDDVQMTFKYFIFSKVMRVNAVNVRRSLRNRNILTYSDNNNSSMMGREINPDLASGDVNVYNEPNLADFLPDEPNHNLRNDDNFKKFFNCLNLTCQIVIVVLACYIIVFLYQTDQKYKNIEDIFQDRKNSFYYENKLLQMDQIYKKLVIETDIIRNDIKEINEWRKELTKKQQLENLKVDSKIKDAINLYDADKTGLIDYALEYAGGSIISTPDTKPYPTQTTFEFLGLMSLHYPSNPGLIITPGTLPGQCFAFEGNNGKIRIKLAKKIQIKAFTIEHANKYLTEDVTSAPKEFRVIGLETETTKTGKQLGQFTYEIKKGMLQNFPITGSHKNYAIVELQILSNYGNQHYTCIYRFRVHGTSEINQKQLPSITLNKIIT